MTIPAAAAADSYGAPTNNLRKHSRAGQKRRKRRRTTPTPTIAARKGVEEPLPNLGDLPLNRVQERLAHHVGNVVRGGGVRRQPLDVQQPHQGLLGLHGVRKRLERPGQRRVQRHHVGHGWLEGRLWQRQRRRRRRLPVAVTAETAYAGSAAEKQPAEEEVREFNGEAAGVCDRQRQEGSERAQAPPVGLV